MSGEKIMIVDDDAEFLEELTETLALSGYAAFAVSDSKAVVEAARKEKPDLILLDLKMKGLNGIQVAQKLKGLKETTHIPLIAMSGYLNNFFTDDSQETLLEVCGMESGLKKPFNPLDVIDKIEKILSKK